MVLKSDDEVRGEGTVTATTSVPFTLSLQLYTYIHYIPPVLYRFKITLFSVRAVYIDTRAD